MRKLSVAIVAIFGFCVFLLAAQATLFVLSPAKKSDVEILFEVKPGSSFSFVASELEHLGLVSSAFKFKVYARLLGKTGDIRVGEYLLNPNMNPSEVLGVISSGKSIQRTFTIPEGQNLYEVAEILATKELGSREQFLKMFKSKQLTKKYLDQELESFEGYLFPETYSYTKYTTPEQVLEMLVANFLKVWEEVGGTYGNMNRHQIVTLASVVEKETGAPEERPVIASVFHNRLQKGMRLQSDPTILYGILVETGVMKKNIQKKDILTGTPYNTYTVKALPKGPIASPGREAISAVLRPKTTDFLYFVSRNDGTHVFSRTYEEHNKAVRDFQLNRRARSGKSWRDLEKRRSDGSKRKDL